MFHPPGWNFMLKGVKSYFIFGFFFQLQTASTIVECLMLPCRSELDSSIRNVKKFKSPFF